MANEDFMNPSEMSEKVGTMQTAVGDFRSARGIDPSMLNRKKKPYVRETPKIGRNEPCPCGSGKKYKKCCMLKDE